MSDLFDLVELYYKVVRQLDEQNAAVEVQALDFMASYMGRLKKIYADLFGNLGEVIIIIIIRLGWLWQ